MLGLAAFLLAATSGFYKSEQRLLWDAPEVGPAAIANATALMFVAFAGYGRLATLGEEVTDPARNIPRAVLITLAITAALYLAVAAAVSLTARHFPPELLRSQNPLAALSARMLRPTGAPVLLTAGAVAALGGSLLNLLLGLSRVVLAMARRGEMPEWFAAVEGNSPRRAVWVVGLCVAFVAAFGSVKLAWSVSACAVLLYYGLTNAAALRLPAEHRRYPRAIAWVGLAGCASLAWFVTPTAAAIVGGWLLAGVGWKGMIARKKASGGRQPPVSSNACERSAG
ncbi:putative transporter [Planctomycetes bacterium LzC2]|uniref:Transporter n=2 Tax=Alienimonas chondri TaxID=2681879 RepID=A0ABX1VLE4_9PLAN|nr:putative transporter [Alienimonas chondri]